jgi:hypothetical protein
MPELSERFAAADNCSSGELRAVAHTCGIARSTRRPVSGLQAFDGAFGAESQAVLVLDVITRNAKPNYKLAFCA